MATPMPQQIAKVLKTEPVIPRISVWRDGQGNLCLDGGRAIAKLIPHGTCEGFSAGTTIKEERKKILEEMHDFALKNKGRIYFVYGNKKNPSQISYAFVGTPLPGFENLGEAPRGTFEAFKTT